MKPQDLTTAEKVIREIYNIKNVTLVKDNIAYYSEKVDATTVEDFKGYAGHKGQYVTRTNSREATEQDLKGWEVLKTLWGSLKVQTYTEYLQSYRVEYRNALREYMGGFWKENSTELGKHVELDVENSERNARYMLMRTPRG